MHSTENFKKKNSLQNRNLVKIVLLKNNLKTFFKTKNIPLEYCEANTRDD